MAVISGILASPITIALFSLVLVALYAHNKAKESYAHRKAARDNGCEPPPQVPSKDPFFGLDVTKKLNKAYQDHRRSELFKEYHDTLGLTYQTTALRKTRIYTIDPDNLRAIFSNIKDWGVQPLRLPPWGPVLGKGVMDSDGTFWRHSRDMVQPLFNRQQISDLASFDIHVSNFLKLIPNDGSTVDMQDLIARLQMDFTLEFLFSESPRCLTSTPDPHAMEFLEAFHFSQSELGRQLQLPILSLLTSNKPLAEAKQIVRNFAVEQVDEAHLRCDNPKEAKKNKYVLADELVKVNKDKVDVQNQLLNAFLAAHDTTATLMTNTVFNLARNPRVYQKLREEVLHLDMQQVNFDELKGLPYLKNVINEALRVTGVVEQTARIALNDTILPTGGGPSGNLPIYVQKGTSSQLNTFSLHRRPEIFGKDVDQFIPERWEGLHPGAWEFMPFINGPRVW
ncbi:hypothetical protein ACLMJK_008279 [Lecanora helva]